MTNLFLIVDKNNVQVFERDTTYKSMSVPLHCEEELVIMPRQFKEAGTDIRSELIDSLNVKDLSNVHLLVLYQNVATIDLFHILESFQDMRQLQLISIPNVLNFIAVQKKLYAGNAKEKLYISYNATRYELKFNEYRYFEARQSSMAPLHTVSTNELLKFANVLATQ